MIEKSGSSMYGAVPNELNLNIMLETGNGILRYFTTSLSEKRKTKLIVFYNL